jgi:glycosyltransferase involved in cell wall biosynthesis
MTVIAERRSQVLLVDTLSGSNYFAVELVRALAPLVKLTVFTTLNSALSERDGIRLVLGFPEYGGGRSHFLKLLTQIAGTFKLARELWKHRNGVVHVQFFRTAAFELPVYALFRLIGGRIVFTAHNALPHELRWWHRAMYGFWYRIVDRIHVMSVHTARELVLGAGVSGDRVHVVPHGNYASFRIAFPPASAEVTRGRLGIGAATVMILFFGLVREYKGVDLLLRAFANLDPAMDACLVIAGGTAPEIVEELEGLIRSLDIQQRVRFLPHYLPDEELSSMLEACDITAFPYRHIYQSGALMLGMTYGKPIVASDIEGFREYVVPGNSAVLADATDSIAFAAALASLVRDADQRQAIGRNAGERAATVYDWNAIARDIVSIYGKGH